MTMDRPLVLVSEEQGLAGEHDRSGAAANGVEIAWLLVTAAAVDEVVAKEIEAARTIAVAPLDATTAAAAAVVGGAVRTATAPGEEQEEVVAYY
jgi:hypothetical protein